MKKSYRIQIALMKEASEKIDGKGQIAVNKHFSFLTIFSFL